MPRYDYQCVSCGHDFELTQSFKEAGTGTCPLCSGDGRRVFHAVPVIYKGSGFYTTDYGRPKTRADNAKEEKEEKEEKAAKNGSDSSKSKSESTSSSDTKTESAAAPASSES